MGFFVNYSFDSAPSNIVSLNEVDFKDNCLINVNPLRLGDFQTWYNKESLKIRNNELFMSLNKISIIDKYRKSAMLEICKYFNVEEEEGAKIIEKVLSYD